MTDRRGSGPKGPTGPRDAIDVRVSREIMRVRSREDNEAESVSPGLRALVHHAAQLARVPVRESTERFSRERLLMAAVRHGRVRTQSIAQGLRQRLGLSAIARRPYTSGFAFVALMAALSLGYMQLNARGLRLPLSEATTSPLPFAAEQAPLTYSSSGGQPAASNYLVAPPEDSAHLRFSDGSEITASPGTRLRVDSTQAQGARVLLETGVARAHITHREHTSWKFVAGPFDVRITGTAFTLAWDAADQVLDLALHEGSVEVESPLGATHLKVKTGQRFHASVMDGTMQLLAADAPERAAAAAEDQAPQAKAGRVSRRAGSQKAQHRASRAERRARANTASAHKDPDDSVEIEGASYADLVRAGAFEQVVNAATQAGLAQTLEHDSAENVRALADAARYLHRTELAVRSLTVLRARFPGTHHSAAAAFLLGRTYEGAEQPTAAKRFYELYERESPSGEFAAEALAGRMRTVANLEGANAARTIAEQYLERYPRGVHAKTAKQLLR